jgi:hypothetical protein
VWRSGMWGIDASWDLFCIMTDITYIGPT